LLICGSAEASMSEKAFAAASSARVIMSEKAFVTE
jgi:hypothetical protein